jgi:hypothetical protein
MKILFLFFLFLLLSMSYAIIIDLMTGLTFSVSLHNMKNPFTVMTLPEYCISSVLLSMMLVTPVVSYFRRKKQSKDAK